MNEIEKRNEKKLSNNVRKILLRMQIKLKRNRNLDGNSLNLLCKKTLNFMQKLVSAKINIISILI